MTSFLDSPLSFLWGIESLFCLENSPWTEHEVKQVRQWAVSRRPEHSDCQNGFNKAVGVLTKTQPPDTFQIQAITEIFGIISANIFCK